MSDDLGSWVGEIAHQPALCNLPDLFDNTDDYPDQSMGGFEQEAGYLGTHFSGWTKRAIQWLDPSTIPLHIGREASYILHAISLPQPPPAGRVAAVQVGQQAPYLMIEARLRADQFDLNIPSEGVIVYQVQTSDPLGNAQNGLPPLNLLTKTALTVGQSFMAANGVIVQITGSVAGGFAITVNDPVNTLTYVPDVTNAAEPLATKTISAAGFVPKLNIPPKYAGIKLSDLWVQSQSPVANSIESVGSTVVLTMAGGTVIQR